MTTPDIGTGIPVRHRIGISETHATQSISADDFKSAFRLHPAGTALVAADPGTGPVALTVSSLASVSVDPPMLVFSVSAISSSYSALERSETVVVHMLGAEQLWLAKLGATSGVDRFANTDWTRLPTGEPLFPSVYAWIRGRIAYRVEAGNSIVYVIHAIEAQVPSRGGSLENTTPLVYHARTWHMLGECSTIAG